MAGIKKEKIKVISFVLRPDLIIVDFCERLGESGRERSI